MRKGARTENLGLSPFSFAATPLIGLLCIDRCIDIQSKGSIVCLHGPFASHPANGKWHIIYKYGKVETVWISRPILHHGRGPIGGNV